MPPDRRTRSTRSPTVGPWPHSAPSPDSDTRSLPSVTLASAQPPLTSPTRLAAGRRTSSRNTSLKAWSPVMSTMGRMVTPGASIGQTKYEMPRCLGTSGSVRARRMPERGDVGEARPDLLAASRPTRRRRARPGSTARPGRSPRPARRTAGTRSPRPPAAGAGSAAFWASVAGVHERRARPADADLVERSAHARRGASRRR